MIGPHHLDKSFQYSSKDLKKFLERPEDIDIKKSICIDVPCGNGRNIFFLASHFDKVIGIDINREYLNEIETFKAVYRTNNISCKIYDLKIIIPDEISKANLVSIIHFYDKQVIEGIKRNLQPGAILFVETPNCRGGNYLDLPNENDLVTFLEGFDILSMKKNYCNSNYREQKNISFTAVLIKC